MIHHLCAAAVRCHVLQPHCSLIYLFMLPWPLAQTFSLLPFAWGVLASPQFAHVHSSNLKSYVAWPIELVPMNPVSVSFPFLVHSWHIAHASKSNACFVVIIWFSASLLHWNVCFPRGIIFCSYYSNFTKKKILLTASLTDGSPVSIWTWPSVEEVTGYYPCYVCTLIQDIHSFISEYLASAIYTALI